MKADDLTQCFVTGSCGDVLERHAITGAPASGRTPRTCPAPLALDLAATVVGPAPDRGCRRAFGIRTPQRACPGVVRVHRAGETAADGCLPAATPVNLYLTNRHLGPVQWAVNDGAGEVGGDPVAFVFLRELFGLRVFAGEVERFDELDDD